MQVINKKIIVIFICLFIFSFGLYKLLDKKEIELDSVILDTQKQDNIFAIYVEEDKNNYKEDELIPTDGYVFNKEKSQCMSIDGNIINNILSYDYENKKLIVDTTESINCYLYFDKGAGLEIIGNMPNNLNNNQAGMYRFQGSKEQVNNNYICFGTSDSNECKTNFNKYMYRIIGIEESGNIKVIKENSLGTYAFHNDEQVDILYKQSEIYSKLNNTNNNNGIFIGSDYVPKEWEDKILEHEFYQGYYGGSISVDKISQEMLYELETGKIKVSHTIKVPTEQKGTTGVSCRNVTAGANVGQEVCYKYSEGKEWERFTSKIGLLYAHDVYYATQKDGYNCNYHYTESQLGPCINSWLNKTGREYVIGLGGYSYMYGFYGAYNVGYGTYLGTITYQVGFTTQLDIRPVFYLKNNIKLIDGNGTETDPFII